jgi:hypothetical protein
MSERGVSRRDWTWAITFGCAVVLGLALVLLLGGPAGGSDQGVFLSVAARMLDGDVLYAEVVDNKDPLFFAAYAGALWVGGWRGPSLLDGLWFALAAFAFAGLLRELRAPRATVVVGFAVYPLALAGSWYFTGLSMLGGLALVPVSAWLWLRGWFAAAGAAAALVLLFKLNLALLVLAFPVVLLVFDRPDAPRLRQAGRAVIGAVTACGVAALVLAAAGSLRAYLDTIAYNVHYANVRVDSHSPVTRVRAHLAVAKQYFTAEAWQAPVTVLVLVAFAAVAVLALRSGERTLRLLVLLATAALGAAIASVALTAYYSHHLQLLALPAALIAASFVTAASKWLGGHATTAVSVVCCGAALWSAGRDDWPPTVSQWRAEPVSVGARELERARMRLYPAREEIPYVVFGTNDENGHAAFIDPSFDLSCRWFHLYDVSTREQFDETIDCFDRERPLLVLATPALSAHAGANAWNSFVDGVRERLGERYALVSAEPPGFEVWRRVELDGR